MMSCEPDSAHLMRRCTGRRATLTPRNRMVLRQCVFQHRDADPDGLRSWVEVRRTINDVSCRSSARPVHHGPILPPIPANHLKGRDVRQRRRTRNQVAGVGRVYQELLVLVATTPLHDPSLILIGHDGGLLVSMRVRQHPVQAGLHAAAWARPARMQRLRQVRRHTALHCATETRREFPRGRGWHKRPYSQRRPARARQASLTLAATGVAGECS
jgi:hypothetical protein